MQLPALRLFISHCGINSAHESLYFAKPLLCVPLFADQQDMAVRVVDSGAGRMVAKDQVCGSRRCQKAGHESCGQLKALWVLGGDEDRDSEI
jgi:hypothetical protein